MKATFLPLAALLSASAATAAAPEPAAAPTGAEAAARQELARIAALDDAGPRIQAVIVTNPEAPRLAAEAEAAGLPLAGRTVLVKDNIETREFATTAGSLALADNRTGRDAPMIERLRAAGGVVLGKTNLSEWANFRGDRSSSGWSAVGGQTRNPHAIDRNPCGSSSGSAAAVAAGFAWAAIGTETNGSITCPAAVNGVVGFKPTVGLVSRTHVVPISASQDTAGPMARSAADAALLLSVIAGSDPADPATEEADAHVADFTAGLAGSTLQGRRIGVLTDATGDLAPLRKVFDDALADMEAAGAVLVPIEWQADRRMFEASYQVLLYEFREGIEAYLASVPGEPPARDLAGLVAFNEGHADEELRHYGQETFREALEATDEDEYRKAKEDAQRLAGAEGIDALLAKYDVDLLVAPTAGPAWPIDPVYGDNFLRVGAGSLAAIAGYPHLTMPMGQVEGLPVGISLMGAQWQDALVLEAGAAYERVRSAALPTPGFRRWEAKP
jgi:amidase